jgi:hypothetical protein
MEKTFFKVKFNSQNQEDAIYSNGLETSVFNALFKLRKSWAKRTLSASL